VVSKKESIVQIGNGKTLKFIIDAVKIGAAVIAVLYMLSDLRAELRVIQHDITIIKGQVDRLEGAYFETGPRRP
jgi:hypothetical protein